METRNILPIIEKLAIHRNKMAFLSGLKKEGKLYLYDWSVIEKEGPRFENMVASHLLKMIDFYNDTGQTDYL